ncbi:hypothetical protein PENSPDRAFT_343561 [Peniophora sp. CONT]|nr:hypothetical protein PENSPDRAFT_343561 [Peniophora sp. CONT]
MKMAAYLLLHVRRNCSARTASRRLIRVLWVGPQYSRIQVSLSNLVLSVFVSLPSLVSAAMPEWNSPAEVEKDGLTFLKFLHLTLGAVIWDFVSTLDYEWGVWTGRRKYLWTVWLYTGCRLALMVWLTLILVIQTVENDCTAFETTVTVLSYVITASASLMIALRVIAIWERKRLVMAISYGLVLVIFVVNVQSLVSNPSRGGQSSGICLSAPNGQQLPTSAVLGTDIVLIVLMLVGLLRMEESRHFGVARYLYHQGLLWMALVVAAEVPAVALSVLSLNEPMTIMMHPFEVSALCICATRMYRGLANYTYEPQSLDVPATMPSMHFHVQTSSRKIELPMQTM